MGITAGTYNAASTEAWVVEIADGSPPTINWLQWLGGGALDYCYALAVNGDEIYASGITQSFTSWETAGLVVGTYVAAGGSQEGWVVEIADGTPPTIAWLQWLGGDSSDYPYALVVNGEELYIGGKTLGVSSWETVGSVVGGAYPGTNPAFIVELADGAPPDANWLQWLGGDNLSTSEIKALAVNGDEIYAGGSTGASTWPGTALIAGTFNDGATEGWVAEIADGGAPAIVWVQWLGGIAGDNVYALSVNGDEVYAGGYSNSFTFWETVGATAGTYNATSAEAWVVEITDGSPPTIAWLQWLGGGSSDIVFALTVNGDEIYAGGYSVSFTSWETVGAMAGTYNAGTEAWVVEITDGSPPTIAWLQWLGGGSSDAVNALTVNGDEVYAGGYSISFTSWETAGVAVGTYNAASLEGWVVEIADGSPPTLAWLQWLGGSTSDNVYTLAVNGDEVYAGGYSQNFTSWETVGVTAGTYNDASTEAWVVEIADGSPPTLAWLQWLGGSATDYVYALVVNGDEVYAAGSSQSFTSWETVGSTAGTYNASSQEAWVVEITDGSPPTVAWVHWLGGDDSDTVYALAVNANEIYAGGTLADNASFEIPLPDNYKKQVGFYVEIKDDAANSANAIFFGTGF